MTLNELILKHPEFKFLKNAPGFHTLPTEKQEFVVGLIEDALFWIELEEKPNANDGFKFLAATYGLQNAHSSADKKNLQGKDRENFIRPHQDLYTMFNPYSGTSNEEKK